MLTVISVFEIAMSKTAQQRTWAAFMGGGTNHSARASTLPYIIRRCETEKIPYTLIAAPGMGYFIKPAKIEDIPA